MAHFKFGVIAPVVQGTFPDASPAAYYRRIAQKPLLRPDGTYYHYKPQSLQAWEKLYRDGGMDALIKPVRKDKGSPRGLPDEAIAEIYRLRDKYPRLNATQIRFRLIEEGAVSAKVSVRCVQRFIKHWNLKAGHAPAEVKDRKAYEEEYFGGMWQADSCHFPYIPDENGKPRKTYLLLIIDDHSRLVVGARLFFNDNAVNFQTLLKGSVSAYGIPNKIFCDNGSPYVNHQTEFICDSIGSHLLHAKVRDGAAKGKVERIFSTVQNSWLPGIDFTTIKSIDHFNEMLAEFIRKYNLSIHSMTGETPMDRFLRSRDRIKSPKSKEWLDECFLYRERRKVRNDSTVRLGKIQFDAPLQFIGQTVDIRFAPGTLDAAYIISDNKRWPLRKTDKVQNCNTKRADLKIDYSKTGGA